MRKALLLLTPVVLLTFLFLAVPGAFSQKPITIGAPLSTAFLYGWDAERGIKLAVKEIIPFAKKRLGSVLATLEQSLDGRDYILDDGFSVADIMLGYILVWFKAELDTYPALLSYVERLQQRPAYIKSTT